MQLRAGARLGPYEITAPIGAGGMGEVYRARDTRLDRSVAIKVLSSALVATPESKARFEREARAISQLNHPQICTLHDIGHHEGTDFLVMEFLEGETLAERLRKGPMALPQLLKAAGEIASALERAHRSGIVHRDLKPGNIMLTKSGAKLLDFGLAKPAVMGAAAGQAPLISAAPTMSSPDPQLSPLTSAGALVGTMQYMSPEQLQGHEADARSDIFAFGAVLYEMATGKRAFAGKSQISVASAILESEPKPISEVTPFAPAGLDRLVRHCLEKNPDERLQSARDIEWAIKDLTAPAEADRKAGAASWMLLAVGAVVILLVVAGALVWRGSPKPQRTMRFSVALPVLARSFALSSDGEWIAMIAPDEKTGRDALFVNQVGSADVVRLAETEGATYPFWSPDGKQIAFFADGWLKKIARTGGPITQLAKAQSGRGGSWGSGGVIVFSPQTGSGVWKVGENGGNAQVVTRLDRATNANATSHRWPQFLPDGKHFLFLVPDFSGPSGGKGALYAGSIDSDKYEKVADSDTNVAYVDPGYLVYVRSRELVAQRFDASARKTLSSPFAIALDVQLMLSVFRGEFAASQNGTILIGTSEVPFQTQLTWFDRSGKALGDVGEAAVQANPTLSPDGKSVAFDSLDASTHKIDVYVHDLQRKTRMRVTFSSSENTDPVWQRDGKAIYFRSFDSGAHVDRVDLSSMETHAVATTTDNHDLNSTSMDASGRSGLAVFKNNNDGGWQIKKFSTSTGELTDFGPRGSQVGIISPDGKWAAYTLVTAGSSEVFVTAFPSGEGKWQVSRGGGSEPRWRADGKELFFLGPHNEVTAAPVDTDGGFRSGSPVVLFTVPIREALSSTDLMNYDVSGDGQRFLVNTPVNAAKAPPLKIILNWAAELKQ